MTRQTFAISRDRPRAQKDDLDRAAKSLEWLRGSLYRADSELEQIKTRIREDSAQELRFADLFQPWAYKPILIGVAMMVFQQFSGLNAALFYAVEILQVAGSNLDALVAAVIVVITMVFEVIYSIYRERILYKESVQ